MIVGVGVDSPREHIAMGATVRLMNRTEAEQLYKKTSADLERVRKEMAELERQESGFRKMVEALLELYPSIEPPVTGMATAEIIASGSGRSSNGSFDPRGKEALKRVFVEMNNKWMTVHDLTAEKQRRGWASKTGNPDEAVRTTVFRMFKAREVERRKRGREYLYRLRKDLGAPAGKAEAPKSDSLTRSD